VRGVHDDDARADEVRVHRQDRRLVPVPAVAIDPEAAAAVPIIRTLISIIGTLIPIIGAGTCGAIRRRLERCNSECNSATTA
jgi:hypothetical protein